MCCGQTGGIYLAARPDRRQPTPEKAGLASSRRSAAPATKYEYTGPTRLTVRAPLSGRMYVFDRRGVVLQVDPADAAALATVPGLRPVR